MSGSRWRTAAALLATGLALGASTRETPDTLAWRSSQAESIQTAVLADLLEEVRSGRVDPILTGKPVCVGLWSTVRVFERGAERDPNPLSLARLKRVEPLVRPASACSYPPGEGLIETATGLRAIRLAAAQPRWVDGDFARVEAAWYVGPFYAAGLEYTVSFAGGRWSADTVSGTWISQRESPSHRAPSRDG